MLLGPARKAGKAEDRRSIPADPPACGAARDAAIPPDESSLINIVAKADLSPQTRTALLALAEAMQRASVLGRARPRTQPWVERD